MEEGLPIPPELESLVLHALPAAYAVVSMFVCSRWHRSLEDRRIGRTPYDRDQSLCALLAAEGDLALLRWARERRGFSWNHLTTSAACASDSVHVLRYQRANGGLFVGSNWFVMCDAAAAGSLGALRYLRSMGGYNNLVCLNAARAGHVDVLKWARSEGFECNFLVPTAAAEHGRREVLEYLLAQSDTDWWPRSVALEAAKRGDRAMLDLVVRSAAERPLPDIDRWGFRMREQNDFIDGAMCGAAMGGRLDLLRELHRDRGWRVDGSVCKAAACAGAVDVLEWLASEAGCDCDLRECMSQAVGYRFHEGVLRWAVAHGAPLFPDLCLRAVNWHRLDALEWLVAAGCPYDQDACLREANGFCCDAGAKEVAVRDFLVRVMERRRSAPGMSVVVG